MTDKHNIEDFLHHIGATVPAKGHGWRKMKCPYHDDRNASAAVNFDLNRFKCHGCDVAGDTYDLIRKERGGTLSEAIEFASSISAEGHNPVFSTYRSSGGVSRNTGSFGRRSPSVWTGSGRRSAS